MKMGLARKLNTHDDALIRAPGALQFQVTRRRSPERLRLARERYAIGGISFANLQILIDRASQDERQLINARYAFAESVVALEERVGRPVRP